MRKYRQTIIIIFLTAAILGLAALILYDYYNPITKKSLDEHDNWKQGEEAVDLKQLEIDYNQKLAKEIIPEFQNLIKNIPSITQESASAMRQKILDLKLPVELKDAHVQLVLLLDMIEDDIKKERILNAADYQKIFDGIINDYEQLR